MATNSLVPPANFVDLLLDAVCIVDAAGHFVYVSAAFERIFGYTPEEIIGRNMIDLVAPADRARTLLAADEIMSGQPKLHFENRYVRKDGREVHIMWTARWSEFDQLRIAVARDITELKRAESMQAALFSISEAANAAEDLTDLYQRIHQIIGTLLPAHNFSVALRDARNEQLSLAYHVDQHGLPPAVLKPSAEVLYAEIVRTGQPLLLTPETLPSYPEHVQSAAGSNLLSCLAVPLTSQKGVAGALFLKSYSGDACYTDKDKELLRFVSTQVAAAIERKQADARLQYLAQYDELTDLPNRRLFRDRLKTALGRSRRKKERMSLLYLDLDKFKQINDSFGHATGDLLLQEISRRLRQCVRASDTVARIGGDEFVILLESINSAEDAMAIAEKIRSALVQVMELNGHSISIMPSIGAAHYPEHGEVEEALLKHADNEMYIEKATAQSRLPGGSGLDGDAQAA